MLRRGRGVDRASAASSPPSLLGAKRACPPLPLPSVQVGCLYQWLLQQGVEVAVARAEPRDSQGSGLGAGGGSGSSQGFGAGGASGSRSVVSGVLGSPAVRLGLVAAAALAAASALHDGGFSQQGEGGRGCG